MDAFINIFKNVLIFIALAVPGFILVKTKILKSSETGALSKLLAYVGMPFLILTSTMDISWMLNLHLRLQRQLSVALLLLLVFVSYLHHFLQNTKIIINNVV